MNSSLPPVRLVPAYPVGDVSSLSPRTFAPAAGLVPVAGASFSRVCALVAAPSRVHGADSHDVGTSARALHQGRFFNR